jgi:hypothetical protein
MVNYYFLVTSLPELRIGFKPDISFEDLTNRLKINLTPKDYEKTVVLRRFIDLDNIRSLLLEEPIDLKGNLNEKELDEVLLIRDGLPSYVFDFLARYDTVLERIQHFSELLVTFFAEEIPKQEGFLKKYLSFEKDWRLVMIGLRSKRMRGDVAKELQFEDFDDPLVAQILAQKDAEHYEPPAEYVELKELFESCGSDPLQQAKAFAEYRFRKIGELAEDSLFSIDRILAYMAQLMIVEYWNELDEKKGKMILDTFKEQSHE